MNVSVPGSYSLGPMMMLDDPAHAPMRKRVVEDDESPIREKAPAELSDLPSQVPSQFSEIIGKEEVSNDTDAELTRLYQKLIAKNPSLELSPPGESHMEFSPSTKEVWLSNGISEDEAQAMLQKNSPFFKEIKRYLIGGNGLHLQTLQELYTTNQLSSAETFNLYRSIKDLPDGGLRHLLLKDKGQDLIVGRFPEVLLQNSVLGLVPNPTAIDPLTGWLNIMSNAIVMKSMGKGSNAAVAQEGFSSSLSPLAASIRQDFLNEARSNSYGYTAGLTTQGVSGGLNWGSANTAVSSSLSLMKGWASAGLNGNFNLAENQLGLSGISAGGFLGGWSDFLVMGGTLNVIGSGGSQFGLGGVISMSKTRECNYKYKYSAEYDRLFDGLTQYLSNRRTLLQEEAKVKSELLSMCLNQPLENGPSEENIKDLKRSLLGDYRKMIEVESRLEQIKEEKGRLHGSHFIEIIDRSSQGLRLQGGAFPSVVGAGCAFRVGKSSSEQDTYRFYTDLGRAGDLIRDGERNFEFLRIAENFDRKGFPDLMYPEDWKVGEEVVTNLKGDISASFIVGLTGCLAAIGTEVGTSATVSTAFELGVRRMPDNKIEVTFRPKDVTEKGIFAKVSGILQAARAQSIAMAVRQTFVFDLDKRSAREAYRSIFTDGKLPKSLPERFKVAESDALRSADNLLDQVQIARARLLEDGILLTYLEKVDVKAHRTFVGSIIPLTRFEFSKDWLKGDSGTVSTDGDVAVARESAFSDSGSTTWFSGRRGHKTYASVKRLHSKPEIDSSQSAQDEYRYRFLDLVLRYVIKDTVVTGDENNAIAEGLVKMFGGNLGRFDLPGHGQTREVVVEMALERKDLMALSEDSKSIDLAGERSGLSREIIEGFQASLKGRYSNDRADITRKFMADYGDAGFAAIVALLGKDLDSLVLRSSSDAYRHPVNELNHIFALYGDEEGKIAIEGKNRSQLKEAFVACQRNLKDIQNSLFDLHDDGFFVSDANRDKFAPQSREHVEERRTRLFAARKKISEFLDLSGRFSNEKIAWIYRNIPSEDRTFDQRMFLLKVDFPSKVSIHDSPRDLLNRFHTVEALISELEEHIDIGTKVLEQAMSSKQYVALGRDWLEQTIDKMLIMRSEALNHLGSDHLSIEELRVLSRKLGGSYEENMSRMDLVRQINVCVESHESNSRQCFPMLNIC